MTSPGWSLDVLVRGLAEAPDGEAAAQRLAEHVQRLAPEAAARVYVVRPGDRCTTCLRAKECSTRDRCLHLVGEVGAFARPPGHAARLPRTLAPWADALGGGPQGLPCPAAPPELAAPGTAGPSAEALLLPLRAAGETTGLLAIRRPLRPAEGLEEGARIAALLAGATTAMLRRGADEERRFEQLRLVHELGQKALSILDPELLLRQSVADVQRHFGFRHVSLFQADPAHERLVLKAQATLFGRPEEPGFVVPLDRGIVGRVARTGKTAWADDVSLDADYVPYWKDTKSEVAVPIVLAGRVEAVLNVESDVGGGFSESDVLVLETAAQQLAVAMDNARLFARVKRSEEQYRDLLESAHVAVISVNATGHVAYANPAAGELTGRPHAALLGTPPLDLADPEDRPRLAAALEAAAAGRAPPGIELRVRHQDGRPRFVVAEVQPLRGEAGASEGVLVLARDVSREKDLQAQLAQAEKLNAIGRTVAGVAHELNNPLAGILGYAQLILAQPPEQWQPSDVARIEANARRCKRIVENLLTFARQARMERQAGDLNAVIESVIALNEYMFRLDGVEMVRDLESDLPPLHLDMGRWQQVFVNLAQNAREAMVEARSPERRITFRTRRRGEAVEVTIEDTGPGMAPEVRSRVFDPFFTGRRHGVGLGLALVFGIVAEHGGTITAESEPGRGARFLLRVPIAPPPTPAPAPAEDPGALAARAPLRGAGRRVAVLDDEEVVREILVRVLELQGYDVDTAADEPGLLRLLEDGPVDVLVLDLLMPDADGLEVYDRLVAERPWVGPRTLFLTGGVPEQERLEARGVRFLPKPFDIGVLAEAVDLAARAEGLASRA